MANHRTTNHDLRTIRECAEAGLSRAAAARQTGMSRSMVCYYAKQLDIPFAIVRRPPPPPHPAPDLLAVYRLQQMIWKIRLTERDRLRLRLLLLAA